MSGHGHASLLLDDELDWPALFRAYADGDKQLTSTAVRAAQAAVTAMEAAIPAEGHQTSRATLEALATLFANAAWSARMLAVGMEENVRQVNEAIRRTDQRAAEAREAAMVRQASVVTAGDSAVAAGDSAVAAAAHAAQDSQLHSPEETLAAYADTRTDY